MNLIEAYVGFHKPSLRNAQGRIDPRIWFGHCEIWGQTGDGTWVFLDPQGSGTKLLVLHRYDDVVDMLVAMQAACQTILRIENPAPNFRIPIHGVLTCAAICGHIVGQRALAPSALKRRLLAKGAEVVHEAQGRSERQSCSAA